MSKAKHAKGPWKMVMEPELQMLPDVNVPTIQNAEGTLLIAVVTDAKGEIANAHLLAAAPIMFQGLEAAEQCIVDFLEAYKNDCARLVLDEAAKSLKNDALSKVRAAIAKAKGETQ